MAYSSREATSAARSKTPRGRLHWQVLAFGAAIAAVIVLAVVAIWPQEAEEPAPTRTIAKKPKKKVRNLSAAADKVVEQVAKESNTNVLSEAWQQYYDGRDTNEWIVVKDPKTGKEHISRLLRPGPKNRKPPLYKAHALNALHAILFKDPGTPLPGIRIDDRFVKSFQDALFEKIEITDEDSEEDKLNKQSMIETMEFLKQEIKNGGDIKAIVGDALLERQRVSTLKSLMVQERVKMRNEGASEEEIAEFEEICNRKLAERGASPLLSRKTILERLEQKLQSKEVAQ